MENLKNQERQPANAATPEKAEEKGQTPKQGKKEARPLTPEEMLKRKKMLVYPLFFLVFLGAMWLIFAPSDSDEPLREGFNVDVPMPEDKGLLSDKKTAYEQSAFEKKQKEKMNTLQDLAVSLEQEEPAADEVFLTEEDTDNAVRLSVPRPMPIRTSTGSWAVFMKHGLRKTIRKHWNWNGAFRSWSVRRRKSARPEKTARSNCG